MEAEQILKRIGYDNNSITTNEKWIAREVYKLAMEDAAALRQFSVVGRSEQCVLHSTDWNGKCFKCGEQVFVREPK